MPLPKAQLQIVAYLIERGDEGATAREIRQHFSLNVNETTTWLVYLQRRGIIEAVGPRGTYRYRVTERCQEHIASALGEAQQASGGWWKWLGLAALLLILFSGENEGR